MLLYKYMFDTQWMDVDFNHEYGKNQRMQNQIQLHYIITVCLWVVSVCGCVRLITWWENSQNARVLLRLRLCMQNTHLFTQLI